MVDRTITLSLQLSWVELGFDKRYLDTFPVVVVGGDGGGGVGVLLLIIRQTQFQLLLQLPTGTELGKIILAEMCRTSTASIYIQS